MFEFKQTFKFLLLADYFQTSPSRRCHGSWLPFFVALRLSQKDVVLMSSRQAQYLPCHYSSGQNWFVGTLAPRSLE